MANNTNLNSSFVQTFVKKIKKIFKLVQKTSKKNQRAFQSIQLTFIYFFAIVVLMYTVKNSLGMLPEILYKIIPFLAEILDFQLLKVLATPEKTFILYLLILEILINRSFFNFSLLVKFNVLLIFILEMFQNLIASYWDLFFSREMDLFAGSGMMVKNVTIFFFCVLFVFFLLIYLYCYFRALQGRFPILPGILRKITDSVGFWLQIKIPNDPKDK